MRCKVMIPIGNSKYNYIACWEPLNDKGKCAKHGQQVFVKPEWMSDDRWQALLRDMPRSSSTGGFSCPDPSDGRPQGADTGNNAKS